MRGDDQQQEAIFSYIGLEQRVPKDHPLRAIRQMADQALRALDAEFQRMYARRGRPSIAPEKLIRAQLLQVLYSVRSERQLMEQLDYNLLFRWFVGLNIDDPIWDVTVFTKNRERLIEGEVAEQLLLAVVEQARAHHREKLQLHRECTHISRPRERTSDGHKQGVIRAVGSMMKTKLSTRIACSGALITSFFAGAWAHV